MLFVVAQFWRPSSTFCIFDNSPFGILSDAVQSSAYLHIFTRPCISTGIESSKSSIKIPNSKGDMTDPCGTPAGQVRVVDSTPGSLTCCILPWRKFCIHCHKNPLMFLPLSLDKTIEWSTRSKALLKSFCSPIVARHYCRFVCTNCQLNYVLVGSIQICLTSGFCLAHCNVLKCVRWLGASSIGVM